MAEEDKIDELEKRVKELELEKRIEKLEKGVHYKKLLIAITAIILVIVASLISISAFQSYNVSRSEHGADTLGFIGTSEQASITNTAYVSSSAVAVTVQNTGSASMTINSATIDGNDATLAFANGTSTTSFNISSGQSETLNVAFSSSTLTFTTTAQYNIKLQTAKGNTIVATYTYTAPAPSPTPIEFMGNAEQASITSTAYVSGISVSVTVQNTGSATVTIASATIDGNPCTMTGTTIIVEGTSQTITVAFVEPAPPAAQLAFTTTAQYNIQLQTSKGNTIVATYTYTGAPTA